MQNLILKELQLAVVENARGGLTIWHFLGSKIMKFVIFDEISESTNFSGKSISDLQIR